MNAAFIAMGGLALLTFIAVQVFIPEDVDRSGDRPEPKVVAYAVVLRNNIVRGLFVLRLITAAGHGTVYTFLPLLAAIIFRSTVRRSG